MVIAVLATCYNRRAVTLAGLRALEAAFGDVQYHVYLVDDGCTDGTGEVVRAEFPDVTVIRGNGSLFWNGGMRKAWQTALADRPDYYLWWNDDLQPLPGSIAALVAQQKAAEAEHGGKVISVGKIVDPNSQAIVYGAYIRAPGLSKLRFTRATGDAADFVTMNGNCVLVPSIATEDVGILSDRYRHSTGDVDFGLRASKAGYRIIQSRLPVGYGVANKTVYSNRNAKLGFGKMKYVLTSPKGIPFDEWLYFCRTHGGWLWPVNFAYRYMRIFGIVP